MSITTKRPTLTDYQNKIIYSPARFTVCEASTKIGKTFSHLWWLYEKSCQPPKNGANYWWVAPVYGQAQIAFNRLKRMVAPSHQFRINESELYIQNQKGATIHFKSAEKPDNLYGEDVFAAVFDEFTRGREEAWNALRTTLTATRGPCKFIGNVRGKKNWGYKLGLKARSGTKDYEYFKVNSFDAVREGILEQAEIDQAQQDLPESAFKELYLAEALEDQANPFGIQHIQRLVKPLSDKLPVAFGVDLAKSVDWTVVVGLDDVGQICVYERWQGDWSQTREKLITLIGSNKAFIDSTGVGNPVVEEIQKKCPQAEGFNFTQLSKQQIMEGLAYAIQNAQISVLDGVMRDELESFEYEYTRSGVRYSAPVGVHDDTVCALALAYHKYRDKPSQPFFSVHQ